MASTSTEPMSRHVFMIKSLTARRPRRACLAVPGRQSIETPHYVAITSRGAVPHLAQDMFAAHTAIKGVHVSLEDFIERFPKQAPPVCQFISHQPDARESALRRFVALPRDNLLVLGPRRCKPVTCPVASTEQAMSVYTSVGFRSMPITAYMDMASSLKPDILIGPGDLPYGTTELSKRKVARINDRTTKWMSTALSHRLPSTDTRSLLFAPILPLPIASQSTYIALLVENATSLDGLAITDPTSIADLPEKLSSLPRLSLTDPSNPHELLTQLSQGVDVFTLPFVGAATDAGIALDFRFPASPPAPTTDRIESSSTPTPRPETQDHRLPVESPADGAMADSKLPLGLDMWHPSHAHSKSPLSTTCPCHACTSFSRAYIRHLLVTKEMLGWVLLQIHNHAVVDDFFAGVRQSLSRDDDDDDDERDGEGSDRYGGFEEQVRAFGRIYETDLPSATGQGPRVRGYQYKSDGPGEAKRNNAAFTKYPQAAAETVVG